MFSAGLRFFAPIRKHGDESLLTSINMCANCSTGKILSAFGDAIRKQIGLAASFNTTTSHEGRYPPLRGK